jgi:hypothetical protein
MKEAVWELRKQEETITPSTLRSNGAPTPKFYFGSQNLLTFGVQTRNGLKTKESELEHTGTPIKLKCSIFASNFEVPLNKIKILSTLTSFVLFKVFMHI